MSDLKSKLQKCRANLIIDQPFFAALLLSMPLVEDNSIPTMATDGESIIYNKDWLGSLNAHELTFVLAHEALHCVFDHMGRREDRSPNLWNQAADYLINYLLIKDKIGVMPKMGLNDPSLVQRGGNTTEGIYKLLPKENESKKAGDSGGSLDQVHDSGTDNGKNKVDPATKKQKSEELKIKVIAAKNIAKTHGKFSAGLDRLVTKLLTPKVDWVSTLRRFISAKAKVDYSYARPNRRFLDQDFILPSLSGEKLGTIIFAVDCSGSMSDKLLAKISAEVNAINEDLKPASIKIIYFDSNICGQVEEYSQGDQVTLAFRGGGGTAFSPVMSYINALPESPDCIVFFTDLECSDFGEAPSSPLLWCVFDNKNPKAPFGEVVEVIYED